LVIATEQIIAVNGFDMENVLTYGQAFAIILLIVPLGILWTRCYHTYPKLAMFFDSIEGQKVLWLTIAVTIFSAYAASVYVQNEDANVQRTVCAIAILCCILPGYIRKQCSEKFDELFGNRIHNPPTSWWDAWSSHLQLRVPSSSISTSNTSFEFTESRKNNKYGKFHQVNVEDNKKHE
jgi:hypothetical protein